MFCNRNSIIHRKMVSYNSNNKDNSVDKIGLEVCAL